MLRNVGLLLSEITVLKKMKEMEFAYMQIDCGIACLIKQLTASHGNLADPSTKLPADPSTELPAAFENSFE
jgi:hypothetical protein